MEVLFIMALGMASFAAGAIATKVTGRPAVGLFVGVSALGVAAYIFSVVSSC